MLGIYIMYTAKRAAFVYKTGYLLQKTLTESGHLGRLAGRVQAGPVRRDLLPEPIVLLLLLHVTELQLDLAVVFDAGVGQVERMVGCCGQRRVRYHDRPIVRRIAHVDEPVRRHHVAGRDHRGIRHLGCGRCGRADWTERAVPVRPPDAGAGCRRQREALWRRRAAARRKFLKFHGRTATTTTTKFQYDISLEMLA